ncbi:MAG TPA: hypothetical protein VMC07_01000 [Candidatus Omnitrophota bacterium]|nr:hypothetical protein [Candidatus Omnitrophota bacterium]
MKILENIASAAKTFVFGAAFLAGIAGFANADNINQNNKYFFEANSWSDTYGDNNIHDWNQYQGIKNNFRDDEEIILIGHDPAWTEEDNVEWRLYGPTGKIVEKGSFSPQSDGDWYHAGESLDEDIMYDLMHSSNGGDGNYKVEWYTDGVLMPGDSSFFSVSSSN